MGSQSDGELWEAAQSDPDAFGLLFERYCRVVLAHCIRGAGDLRNAEDLMSVTFLEAWRKRHVQLRDEHVLPWLLGIASNVLRNERRSLRRYRNALARLPEDGYAADFSDDVVHRQADRAEVEALRTRFAGLPVGEREALLLVGVHGLTIAQAAFALDIKPATVRSRLFRARQRFDPGQAVQISPATEEH